MRFPSVSSSHSSWAAAAFLCAQSVFASIANASAPADELVERGQYLATAGNCATCHTTAGGQPYAGGLVFETAFGRIYSTNISPDPETGIGNWTQEQFLQALRQGVRPNGEHLYPVFPYTSFTKISDDDAAAIYAYLKTVPAVKSKPPENQMSWPYSQRSLLSLWKKMFLEPGAYVPVAGQSAEWNRGAYLVESLGHCSACHSPRNLLGAEDASRAMTGGIYMDKVATGDVRTWSAPNLTSASSGLGTWSVEDVAAYLKTGRAAHAITFGPMNEVIMNSTQHLTDADVRALAVYLKSLPAKEATFASPPGKKRLGAGETLYDIYCGTCHLPTGLGSEDTAPRLAGSPVVQASDPSTLINIILYGPQLSDPPPPMGRWQRMEDFGDKLSDDDVALLASYVRSAWDNKGGEVTVDQVAAQR